MLRTHRASFLKISSKLRMAFGTSVAILLVVIVLAHIGLEHMRSEVDAVINRDCQVIVNANQIMKLALDMETGQRGFVITGKEEFLDPYHNALTNIESLLDEQRGRVSDEPDQVARLDHIQQLIGQWQAKAGLPEIAIRRRITERHEFETLMTDIVISGKSKAAFDELRQTIAPLLLAFEEQDNAQAVQLLTQFEKRWSIVRPAYAASCLPAKRSSSSLS